MPTPPLSTIAQTHQLGYAWPGRPLFERLEIAVQPGVTLLCGEEQSGKTSLLRILAGELAPTQGWVTLQGIRPDQQPSACAALVFRTDPLSTALDHTTPQQWFESLPARYPLLNAGAVTEMAQAFGLAPHLAKPMYMLSAGSRRKVWLSAAIASGAPLTLIDQPFAALDGPSIRLLLEMLQDFAGQTARACVIADYEAPPCIALAATITL